MPLLPPPATGPIATCRPAQAGDPSPLDLYTRLVRIRSIETAFLEHYAKGRIKGTVHTCLGQEACAVGVFDALERDTDFVFTSHRGHGHFLAYGGPAEGLVAEVLGRATGICSGAGGTQNLHWKRFFSGGIQGGLAPIACGVALAQRLEHSAAVVAVFLGDGTMGEGNVYEAFQLAVANRLPVLFVLEHNAIAQSTPTASVHAGDLAARAAGFGLAVASVDGTDPYAVRHATRSARAAIVANGQPNFLLLDTVRLGPHSKGDDPRTTEEIAALRRRDPVLRLARSLAPEDVVRIDRAIEADTAALFATAFAAPLAVLLEEPAHG